MLPGGTKNKRKCGSTDLVLFILLPQIDQSAIPSHLPFNCLQKDLEVFNKYICSRSFENIKIILLHSDNISFKKIMQEIQEIHRVSCRYGEHSKDIFEICIYNLLSKDITYLGIGGWISVEMK